MSKHEKKNLLQWLKKRGLYIFSSNHQKLYSEIFAAKLKVVFNFYEYPFSSVTLFWKLLTVRFNVQVLVVPPLVEGPSLSWVHFFLKEMAEDYEETQCPGTEVA